MIKCQGLNVKKRERKEAKQEGREGKRKKEILP